MCDWSAAQRGLLCSVPGWVSALVAKKIQRHVEVPTQ